MDGEVTVLVFAYPFFSGRGKVNEKGTLTEVNCFDLFFGRQFPKSFC